MMDEPQSNRTGWAQRLQDWEATAPARPGEGPAPDFWAGLESDLPAPPPPNSRRPLWLWGALGLLLLTHFTCFQPELGYFPLGPVVVAESAVPGLQDEQGGTATAMPGERAEGARREPLAAGAESKVATASNEEQTGGARREPRLTGEEPHATGAEGGRVATASNEEQTGGARREPRLTGEEPRATGEEGKVATASNEEQTGGARREPRLTEGANGLQVWVGTHYAPVSNRTRLTLDPGILTASRTRQTLAPELGLNLYLRVGEHWGLRTAYTSTQVETESQYRFIRFFNPQFESPNTAGDGVSKYAVDVASPYTKSSAEVELVRPRDRVLQNGARLRIDLRVRETVALQSIPLQLTYGNRWGRFELSGQLGPEWTNIRVLDFTAGARVQQPGLQADRVRIQSRERISSRTYWSLSGGLAATYHLGDRWRLGVIPEFTTSLENLSAQPGFSARSRSAGVRLEVGYRLK